MALDSRSDGFALVRDTGYRHLNFELDDVTLDGMMPKGADAEAVDVAESVSSEETDSEMPEAR